MDKPIIVLYVELDDLARLLVCAADCDRCDKDEMQALIAKYQPLIKRARGLQR